MTPVERAAQLIRRYTVTELGVFFRLKALGALDRRRARRTPRPGVAGPLQLPVGVTTAQAVLAAWAPLSASDGIGGPTVLRIQAATDIWLARVPPNEAVDWLAIVDTTYSAASWHWHPYTVSTRLIVWMCAASARKPLAPRGAEVLAAALEDQSRFLSRRLETHLGGNHLLRQLIALVMAADCLPESRLVRESTYRRLGEELNRQFIDEAVHFENSPMYHGHALLDVALLSALGRLPSDLAGQARRILRSATVALASMTRPDGEYARFGDSTRGLVAAPGAVTRVAESVLPPPKAQESMGPLLPGGLFVRSLNEKKGDWLAFRASARPPRTCPGHWHDDLLSLELFTAGRLLVGSAGILSYDPGQERAYSRSSAAHSTIQCGAQAQKWGSFRIGAVPDGEVTLLPDGGCRGRYRRLGTGAEISRTLHVESGGARIRIVDDVSDVGGASSRFVLAPDVTAERLEGTVALVRGDAAVASLSFGAGVEVRVRTVPFYPSIGESVTTIAVDLSFERSAEWRIQLGKPG